MRVDKINLGTVVSGEKVQIDLECPFDSLHRHALVTGAPGTGKTTFAINILTQFAEKGIPFIVVSSKGNEYRRMISSVPDLQIFTLGKNKVSPFIINPFIPPEDVSVEQYIPGLVTVFKSVFDLDVALEMIFIKSINKCYEAYGWEKSSKIGDANVRSFSFNEFVSTLKEIIASSHFVKDVKSNIERTFILPLINFIEQNSAFFDATNTFSISEILNGNTLIEIDEIDSLQQKCFFVTLLLLKISSCMRNQGQRELKNIVLLDEVSYLGSKTKNYNRNPVKDIFSEFNLNGTGIIVVAQKPSMVFDNIMGYPEVKVIFRIVSPKEKECICENMDGSNNDLVHLSDLRLGQALVNFRKLDSPIIVNHNIN